VLPRPRVAVRGAVEQPDDQQAHQHERADGDDQVHPHLRVP
jgi:hypothetical protein